jgi:hypothetical protein
MLETPSGPRRRRRRTTLAAAVVAAAVAGLAGWIATRSPSADPPTVRANPPVVAPPTPAASTAPTRPPATGHPATERPAAGHHAVRHDRVPAAAPVRFTMHSNRSADRFTIRAHVCGMAYIRPLDPPGEQHHTVCWVQNQFGYAPGSSGRGTTYVLGHAWSRDPQEVLNKVSETAMRQVLSRRAHGSARMITGVPTYPVTVLNGAVISLRTPHGLLRYTVRDAYAVAKEQAALIGPLMDENVRNRVVLITCGELRGVDYGYNIIVDAYLSSSVAATT